MLRRRDSRPWGALVPPTTVCEDALRSRWQKEAPPHEDESPGLEVASHAAASAVFCGVTLSSLESFASPLVKY